MNSTEGMQGPDIQESPRGGGGSSVASGSSSGGKPDRTQPFHTSPVPQMMPPGAMPVQGQVLVDPATGQHYIVPQTHFYQPMQPMYYPPAHQPTPMYYPYSQAPQGYMIPQGGQYPMQMPSYPATSSSGMTPASRQFAPAYRQTMGSTDDVSKRDPTDEPTPASPSFSSHSSVHTQFFQPHVHQPYPYASPYQQFRLPGQQPAPSQTNQRSSPNLQPDDPESGFNRDITRSSGEFVRPTPTTSLNREHAAHTTANSHSSDFPLPHRQMERLVSVEQATPQERTPLYGAPAWWSSGAASSVGVPTQRHVRDKDTLTDIESRRQPEPMRVSPPVQSSVSDTEATRPRPAPARPVRMDIDFNKPMPEDEQPKAKPLTTPTTPVQKSVRMDIDLSKYMREEEEIARKKAAAAEAAAARATAFTVNFDSGEGVSLQDAARKSAQARRMLNRRSGMGLQPGSEQGPGSGSASGSGNSPGSSGTSSNKQVKQEEIPTERPVLVGENATNKNYLLNKLLHGKSEDADNDCIEMPNVPKDEDVTSEAKTFVVDPTSRPGGGLSQMMQTKIVEDSDASTVTSDSDSDSEDETKREDLPPPPPRRTMVRPTSTATSATTTVASTEKAGDLLAKLRQMSTGMRPVSSTGALPSPGSYSGISAQRGHPHHDTVPTTSASSASSPLPPLTKRTSLGSQPTNRSVYAASRATASRPSNEHSTTNAASTSPANPFRRGDGGRFSMRTGLAGPSSPQQQQKRPPFRAGGALSTRPVPPNQKEQEMNAWLRRKDYNPMKAAAEAKKAKELKSRADQFMSNRSISFHVGPAKVPTTNNYPEMCRNRSQESLAVDEADQASQRVIAEYSRGVVKDINRLSQQNSRASGSTKDVLRRTIEMLTQKCKKSIELIRSQSKGCLSVSVEDLLATAAEPPRPDESLDEQLDRLCEGFDAVQRYLEQYSLDGHQSPIPEFLEDGPDSHSVVSGASAFSFTSRAESVSGKLAAPSAFSSPIRQTSPGGRSSTGYRSRVLASRSPSGGRSTKN